MSKQSLESQILQLRYAVLTLTSWLCGSILGQQDVEQMEKILGVTPDKKKEKDDE